MRLLVARLMLVTELLLCREAMYTCTGPAGEQQRCHHVGRRLCPLHVDTHTERVLQVLNASRLESRSKSLAGDAVCHAHCTSGVEVRRVVLSSAEGTFVKLVLIARAVPSFHKPCEQSSERSSRSASGVGESRAWPMLMRRMVERLIVLEMRGEDEPGG